MNLNEKAEKTVSKLLKLTRENELDWSRSKFFLTLFVGSDERVNAVYTANHGEVRFRVYEASYQTSPDGVSLHWTSEPRVEIVDYDETVLWRLPRTAEMWDLLETIKVKAGKVEETLDQFLSDE